MLTVLEVAVVIILLLFFVTQVVWPAASGRQLFPLFGTRKQLENELSKVREEADNAELRRTIDEEREKLPK